MSTRQHIKEMVFVMVLLPFILFAQIENWVYWYNGPGNSYDYAHSIVYGADWNIYAAGSSQGLTTSMDFLVLSLTSEGDERWVYRYNGPANSTDVAHDLVYGADRNIYATGESMVNGTGDDFTVISLRNEEIISDDPLALAYNGKRHLVRKPNTYELHLTYTDQGKVIYRYSSNGGIDWTLPDFIGDGGFPAIYLDSDNNPCVTWTKEDTLLYSRKDPSQGWQTTKYTFEAMQPSHPCITISYSDEEEVPDTVHILVRFSNPFSTSNSITEVSFPVTNPSSYQTRILESFSTPNMITLDFSSIARDYQDTLHAAWMHGDTVWYGTRGTGQTSWSVWGAPFAANGRNSDHPFTECYGDSVFVVWQNESDDEVWRGGRQLQWPFQRANLSYTSTTPSIYPVNASGMVTTFVDKSSTTSDYDVFWKKIPTDPLHNISNTSSTKSIFPHACLRITAFTNVQYTAWQEGNSIPYQIKFDDITINPTPPSAYFISIAGSETPSLHLVERDSFISSWQVPVDCGYETVSYQFSLDPEYQYKLKAIGYHEGEDKWKMKVMIDNEEVGEIEYESCEPKTLEIWVSPEFYADSVVEVVFECDDGDFAAVGPVYIYQYEYEETGGTGGGGPMAQQSHSLNSSLITFSPNPFNQTLNIKFQSQTDAKYSIKAYNVTGRVVKSIYEGMINGNRILNWKGDDDNKRTVSQGIYFLRVENLDTKETFVYKTLRIK